MTKDEWYKQLFERLDNSKFRSSFHLKQKDIDYINEKGLERIRQHAEDFISKRNGEALVQIFVDADACPVVGIIETIAEKYNIPTTLLCDTNHILYSNYSEVIVVGAGADAVDYKLISICHKGDIVVSQDYGVAAMALGKGAYAIHQSGKWYTNNNIDQMLMERHLNKKARRSSHKNHIKGPKKRTEEDDVRFAQSFEKMLMMVQEKFQKNTKTMETGEMQL